jgi:hypothetical protein
MNQSYLPRYQSSEPGLQWNSYFPCFFFKPIGSFLEKWAYNAGYALHTAFVAFALLATHRVPKTCPILQIYTFKSWATLFSYIWFLLEVW